MDLPDYYEFLQISRQANPSTIKRVYTFLLGRLRPDNPETGDAGKYKLLKQAYAVLSDPERRARYDATYTKEAPAPPPLSDLIDFMDSSSGESNRRLAVLALLYTNGHTSPHAPGASLNEVEMLMGFPRDYLQFTMWYLRSKNYITAGENEDFTLTEQGVDFVESNWENFPVLNKLLTMGPGTCPQFEVAAGGGLGAPRQPLTMPAGRVASEWAGTSNEYESVMEPVGAAA